MNNLTFLETNHSNYVNESEFCDRSAPMIVHTAKKIVSSAATEQEKAVRLFNWVRDNIRYQVGLYTHRASDTFIHRFGSCTNKANLLVAMFRAAGIPAAFRLYRVKTREYFGPLCSKRLTQFMSFESIHVFASVHLNQRWLRVDPTDDYRISQGGDHLNPQCKQVHFNGQDEALLNLDCQHIVSEIEENMLNVDDILKKESRLSEDILWVMNAYLNFVRSHGKFSDTVPCFEESFFTWFELTHPIRYKEFCVFEKRYQEASMTPEKSQNPSGLKEMNT
ncbi:MAG: transglutaminase-like domain-containing protein [Pseudobdellovibrionaceae bacterium]